MPVLAAPYRSFSAGPAASGGTATVQKPPPLVDWGQAPSALPDPTILEPLSAAFLSLPPTLSLSYAAFIPLFTVLYRTCTTLPVTFWQQARIRRFRDLATPVLKRELAKVALETRAECRRAGKSFEEYQAEYKKRAKRMTHEVARRFNCSPRLTLFLPPLAHIPLLVTFSLVLRDACARAESVLAVAPSQLSFLLSASPTSALTESGLAHLHELASTSWAWCPSLILPDPSMLLPLGVGLSALLNVEVNQRTRRATSAAAADEPAPAPVQTSTTGTAPTSSPSIAERRRLAARRARGERSLATHASPPSSRTLATDSREVEVTARKPNSQRIVTNVLRLASVAFIPIAGMAPSAVCLYWLTSNLYTLTQNLTFWWFERGREKERRMRDILSGRAVGV
ncbi:hypothetical protein RHOSPDRAFT_35976 [Rhodotorula sp. JG-1b]|nr:hypothetical protein RHOSPDRAFT_35976 [Rhodotorula sp. JG-1b]